VQFVFLHGDFDLFLRRLDRRKGHYMGAGMLRSQFDDLEIPGPEEAIRVDASRPAEEIVMGLIAALEL
jgi:gluconokinase